jgi:hypothetical protein
MNRAALGVLIFLLALSACTPGLSPSASEAQATSKAFVATAGAQTMAALPTLTMPPTNTPLPTQPPTQTNTSAPPPTATKPTSTASATQPPTVTGTPPTATASATTGATASPTKTATGTPPTATNTVTGTPPTATATDLMVTRVYGTQPPYVDYGRVELRNLSKTDVYISFQCTTPDGQYVIVEYPVGGSYIKVSVPAGRCAYVAWVGGREFTGEFGLKPFEELIFTFKKDSVTIQ